MGSKPPAYRTGIFLFGVSMFHDQFIPKIKVIVKQIESRELRCRAAVDAIAQLLQEAMELIEERCEKQHQTYKNKAD